MDKDRLNARNLIVNAYSCQRNCIWHKNSFFIALSSHFAWNELKLKQEDKYDPFTLRKDVLKNKNMHILIFSK